MFGIWGVPSHCPRSSRRARRPGDTELLPAATNIPFFKVGFITLV